MHALYTPALARRWRRIARGSLALSFALALCGWAVCAFLCTRVRTGNAANLFPTVLAISTGSGWAAILVFFLLHRPARAEYQHISGILQVPPSPPREGRLHWMGDAFQLPGSIRVRKARLDISGETASLLIDQRLAGDIPEGAPLHILTRRRFITDFEVLHEND